MFKKSLTALAVLGVAAGYASAADVTLYGIVDTGLIYTHTKNEDGNTSVKQDSFALESGVSSASRFGIKGTEDLGNGLKVGFKLENGFSADSGVLNQDNRLFGREASVSIYGDFGTLSMGRMGGVASAAGTYDIVFATADAFDGGDNHVFGFATSDRYDNMVTYQTPKFAGMQATVQYSFNEDSKKDTHREGSAAVNRYASAALTGDFGALQTVVAYEFQNYESNDEKGTALNHDDGNIVYLGGNYDCGFAKTFVMAQYFKGIKSAQLSAASMVDDLMTETGTDTESPEGLKGYGLHLGTIVPVAGGDLTVAAYYTDGEEEGKVNADFKSYAFGAKYEYFLSKRTSLYTGAGYAQIKGDDDWKDQVAQAYAGLTHRF